MQSKETRRPRSSADLPNLGLCVSLDCCHTGLPQAKHRLKRKPCKPAHDPQAVEAGPDESNEGPPTDIEVASLEMNSFLFSGTPVFVMSKTQKFRNFRTAEKKTRFNPEARAGCPRLSPGRPGRASGLKPYFFFSKHTCSEAVERERASRAAAHRPPAAEAPGAEPVPAPAPAPEQPAPAPAPGVVEKEETNFGDVRSLPGESHL